MIPKKKLIHFSSNLNQGQCERREIFSLVRIIDYFFSYSMRTAQKNQAPRAFRATNWNDVGNQAIFNFASSPRSRVSNECMIRLPFALDKPLYALNSGYSSQGIRKMLVSHYNSGKSLINYFRKINHSTESGDANKAEMCRNTLIPICLVDAPVKTI